MTERVPMNQELRDEWINRLLDDDTLQCQSTLREIDDKGTVRNCCWGVYADILVELGKLHRIDDCSIPGYHTDNSFLVVRGMPTLEMLHLGGINENAGPTGDIRQHLIGLNDSGSNFPYIASVIREFL